MNTESIWIDDCAAGGVNIYLVMRGHQVLDELVSTEPLTWPQQRDIIAGYREGLATYNKETE